ncbi:MAG: hypothetical protein Q8T04_14265 [Bacteroidota bacterium]|nr:hypothetical protein [Bacteroidota bacterium]
MTTSIYLTNSQKGGYYTSESGTVTVDNRIFNGILYKVILSSGIGIQEEHWVYKKESGDWVIPLTESDSSIKDDIRSEIEKIL